MSRRMTWPVIGLVLTAIAGPTLSVGTELLALSGSDNQLRVGPRVVSTPGRAVVSSVAQINDLSELTSVPGDHSVEIQSVARHGDHGVFVGIAAAEVDHYLAGADIDIVTDLGIDPFSLGTDRRPGTATIAAPGTQKFWVAEAGARSGTAALSWVVRHGDFRIVVMNDDAAPGVDVDSTFAVGLPAAFALGTAALVTGLALGGIGVSLLLVDLRSDEHPARGVPHPRRRIEARTVAGRRVDTEDRPNDQASRPGVVDERP